MPQKPRPWPAPRLPGTLGFGSHRRNRTRACTGSGLILQAVTKPLAANAMPGIGATAGEFCDTLS